MKKLLGFLAVAGLLVIAAPAQQAQASMMTPGMATAVQNGPESLTTEVRWRRHGGWRRGYVVRRHYWRPRFHRRHWW